MFRSPTSAGLPGLSVMLSDIPANPAQISRHLGITERTLQRYVHADQAPRSIQLALFWETRWGRSAADTEAANWAAQHYRLAMVEKRRSEDLAQALARFERELDELARLQIGAANAPLWQAR